MQESCSDSDPCSMCQIIARCFGPGESVSYFDVFSTCRHVQLGRGVCSLHLFGLNAQGTNFLGSDQVHATNKLCERPPSEI